MATRKKKAPTRQLSFEMLELLRGELRKSLAETHRLKWEAKKVAEQLKHHKGKQAELYRLVTGFEKALEDKKIATLVQTILGHNKDEF